MCRHRVGEQVRAPERGATPAAVERVGAQHGVANGGNARRYRHAVDDVLAPAIDQPGHQVHLVADRRGAAIKPRLRRDQLLRARVERRRRHHQLAQFFISCWRCERDAERAVIASEDAVLHVPKVATDWAARRARLPLAQAIEATEVHDAGFIDDFRHGGDTDLVEPVAQRTAPTGGDDREVGSDFAAIGESNTPHVGRCGTRVCEQTADTDARAQPDRAFGERRAAQHPLERRPPTRQHDQFFITGQPLEVGDQRRHVVAEAHLSRTLAQ